MKSPGVDVTLSSERLIVYRGVPVVNLDGVSIMPETMPSATPDLPYPDLCTLSLIWNEFAAGRVL